MPFQKHVFSLPKFRRGSKILSQREGIVMEIGKSAIVAVLLLALAGCSYGIIKITPDTYMVSKTGASIFSKIGVLKSDVFRQANEFAASQGKVMIPLAVDEKPCIPGVRHPSVELLFRVADEADTGAK